MTKVHIVQCCFDADVKHTVGPYKDEETADAVAEAIETHFWTGGDQHVRVEERLVK